MFLALNGIVANDERKRPRLKQLEWSFETHCYVACCIKLLTVNLTYIWVAAQHFSPASFCREYKAVIDFLHMPHQFRQAKGNLLQGQFQTFLPISKLTCGCMFPCTHPSHLILICHRDYSPDSQPWWWAQWDPFIKLIQIYIPGMWVRALHILLTTAYIK